MKEPIILSESHGTEKTLMVFYPTTKNADHGSSVGTRDPRFIRTVIYAWWLSKYGKRIALHISGLRFSPPRL